MLVFLDGTDDAVEKTTIIIIIIVIMTVRVILGSANELRIGEIETTPVTFNSYPYAHDVRRDKCLVCVVVVVVVVVVVHAFRKI